MPKIIIRTVLPEREDCFIYLKENIPDAIFCFDENKNAMHTFIKALLIAGNDSCLHMEDDIFLCDDFLYKVCKVIREHKNEVIQFFSMRKADLITGSRYDYGRNFSMNQCFYLPESYSKKICDYYKSWPRKEEHPTGYDLMIADFLKERKEKYWIHVPSLVQHKNYVSLINKKRSRFRRSFTFEK